MQILSHSDTLLTASDPSAYRTMREDRASPFILVADHAGRCIPQKLADLGVSTPDLSRHIAWDIGIENVALIMRNLMGCALITQTYSRLVIDCNRALNHPTSIVSVADGTVVSKNAAITAEMRYRREQEVFTPYHAQIAQMLDEKDPRSSALIAMHSFTPCLGGEARPWPIALLYHQDRLSAQVMKKLLTEEGLGPVGDNEPYRMTATSDWTVPFHAERRNLPYLEIEIRQDLIAQEIGQRKWAEILARLLPIYWTQRTALAQTQRYGRA